MNLSLLTASFLTVILQLLDCLFLARVIYIQIIRGVVYCLFSAFAGAHWAV